jgi:integrase
MNNSRPDRTVVRRPNPPSASEIRLLLAETPKTTADHDLHDVVLIVAGAGLRAGELRLAKWADMDFRRRCLRVRSKNSAGNRVVPFGPTVLARLIERHRQLPRAEFVLGAQPDNCLRQVSHQLRKASEAKFGRRINLHSIRHFFAAEWIQLGGQLESLARVAGWALPRVFPCLEFVTRQEPGLETVIQEQIEKSITS